MGTPDCTAAWHQMLCPHLPDSENMSSDGSQMLAAPEPPAPEVAGPTPELRTQGVWGGAWEFWQVPVLPARTALSTTG